MSGWIQNSDTIDDYTAICEQAAADPRYQQIRAAMVRRIRTYARTLIHDTSVSDDEYNRRTSSYGLEQLKAFLRETEFLYAQARTALAATGQLGKPPATPATAPSNTEPETALSSRAPKIARLWADEWYEDPWYVAARSAMATRIRQNDLSMIDDPDVSDEQFNTLSDESGYQQTRQLFTETIATLSIANPPT